MRGAGVKRGRLRFVGGLLAVFLCGSVLLQGTATTNAADPAPASLPAPAAQPSTEELLRQMQQLRQEVEEMRKARTQSTISVPAGQLQPVQGVLPPQRQVSQPMQGQSVMFIQPGQSPRTTLPPGVRVQNDGTSPDASSGTSGGSSGSFAEDTADPQSGLPGGEGPAAPGSGDNFPITASYRYNSGGGYTSLSACDGEFTINLQNLVALDGTFFDKASINTPEKGFNIPYTRNYLFGNITKDWDYQLAFQESLGSFNYLDMWLNYRACEDKLNVRFGRMVTPFLYEYYIFWPGFGPVITDSPLFQIAGRRRQGVMVWGRLLDNKIQYQQGVFNSLAGGFFNLDRFVNYTGSIDFTPWKGTKGMFDSLGAGVGVQTGLQQFALGAGTSNNFVNGAGEPSTLNTYVSSTGVPFFQYVPTMIASGPQTRVAPHIYWYGQFSVLAEWAYSQRELANTATGVQGVEQVNGYYVTLSYFLTGESYSGDGLSGFGAIAPKRPFIPSKHEYGSGAWELGFQYSQLQLANSVVTNGFADPLINATRLNQYMLACNWWMNKYTKFSVDWVNDQTNKAVPLGSNGHLGSEYNIFWTRVAMMF